MDEIELDGEEWERAFMDALAVSAHWALGDEGTLHTLLVCKRAGHEEGPFQDREAAYAFLSEDPPCDRCAEIAGGE